jgi:hypothetical protein
MHVCAVFLSVQIRSIARSLCLALTKDWPRRAPAACHRRDYVDLSSVSSSCCHDSAGRRTPGAGPPASARHARAARICAHPGRALGRSTCCGGARRRRCRNMHQCSGWHATASCSTSQACRGGCLQQPVGRRRLSGARANGHDRRITDSVVECIHVHRPTHVPPQYLLGRPQLPPGAFDRA